ncbi:acyl-CoA dehydrogenase family protein [Nocardioides korecus]
MSPGRSETTRPAPADPAPPRAVRLGPADWDRSDQPDPTAYADLLAPLVGAATEAAASGDGVTASLRLAEALGGRLPLPGQGSTQLLWEALATLGAVDLTVARVVEPHLDACAILAEAGMECPAGATLGVYAAEGPGRRLEATELQGSVVLDGTKPWCSLADQVSHALVTAWVDERERGLFLVDLVDPGVRTDPDSPPWVARGLAAVTSTGLVLERVDATAVGAPGWYLTRPGFAWGGIGVAAIWYGGAVGVARRVHQASTRREPDQVGLAHLGEIDVALAAARAVLAAAARTVDGAAVGPAAASRLALQVRTLVADTVETVLRVADHALGPGPLALEEEHARRVDDLRLYVRQHHAERDRAALGRAVLEASEDQRSDDVVGSWW